MTAELAKRMYTAAETGDLALVKQLAAQGVGINVAGDTAPLIGAAHRGHLAVVQWLLDNGADVNIVNSGRSTALMCAAYSGHAHCIELLLQHGADATMVNSSSKTAMTYARENGGAEAVRALECRPDEISSSWTLDNRVMQEIYDFRRLERVTLMRKSAGGDVEAMQREAFSQLPDHGALQKAFDEHRRRGGKRSEEEVFDTGFRKLKINLPRRSA